MISIYDVIIIWAGPAGLWIWNKLQELGINYMILEKNEIWSSFLQWNEKTKFISPSFPSNAFWQVDLNSIDYSSSPWFVMWKEHLNGKEYAEYLKFFAQKNKLKISEKKEVLKIEKNEDIFKITTKNHSYFAKYICCASWEFESPNYGNIHWKELWIHSSEVKNYDNFKDVTWKIPVIWWYESAIDMSYNLLKNGKEVSLFARNNIADISSSDPSKILSPNSRERLKEMKKSNLFHVIKADIQNITEENWKYILSSTNNENFIFNNKVILATGFQSGFKALWELISYRPDGHPDLNTFDELKQTNGVFISWPMVRQEDVIFCFIYKFRQRFWVIALEIAKRLELKSDLEYIQNKWEKQGFYLDDFSSCCDECNC